METKHLASDSGFIVTAILDGDIHPQSKRDAFKRCYTSTINRINCYYCRQPAMKLACKPVDKMTNEDKKKLDTFNNEAKALESFSRMTVSPDFIHMLDTALQEINGYKKDRQNGGYVSEKMIKAEFEADYIMAYRFRQGLSDLVYSTDADMSALCGPLCISVCSFSEEKKKKRKRSKGDKDSEASVYVYDISGGSNRIMKKIQTHLKSNYKESLATFDEAK